MNSPDDPNRLARSSKSVDDEIDLLSLIRTIWQGKWWIVLTTSLALSVGSYYAFKIAQPTFMSNIDLAIEVRAQNVVDIESVLSSAGSDDASVNTELVILKSRRLLERLVKEMGLDADPRFNTSLQPDKRPALFRIFSGAIQQVTRFLQGPSVSNGSAIGDQTNLMNSMVDKLRGAISTAAKRKTYVYGFSVVTRDPHLSEEIANTLAELYLQNQVDMKAAATQRAIDWLALRVQELQQELDGLLAEIDATRISSSFTSGVALEASRAQSIELQRRRDETLARISEIAQEITILEQFLATNEFEVLRNKQNTDISPALVNRAIGGDKSAQILLSQNVSSLLEQRRVQLDQITTQQGALTASVSELQAQIGDNRAAEARLLALTQKADVAQILYDSFFKRLRETTVQLGLLKPDSALISHAIIGKQIAPRKTRIMALAIILGFLLGIGGVLIRYQLRHKVFLLSNDLEEFTGLPVMGQIPALKLRKRDQFLPDLQDNPVSMVNEAYRNLRTSIQMSSITHEPQVIMITSTMPNEGKTSHSLALALQYGALKRKTLLVECDLRRRTLNRYFMEQRASDRGLVSVARGDVMIEDAVVKDALPHCDLLLGEKTSINAADFFASEQFTDFIAVARTKYDQIILDTPPVLVVPDARLIGQVVDAALFSVHWGYTHREQVSAAIKMLEIVNVKVSGTVLNRIDAKQMKSYGYGGKYGNYGVYSNYGSSYYDK